MVTATSSPVITANSASVRAADGRQGTAYSRQVSARSSMRRDARSLDVPAEPMVSFARRPPDSRFSQMRSRYIEPWSASL
jgi:hypothetical protein